jgi:hypothetical protein
MNLDKYPGSSDTTNSNPDARGRRAAAKNHAPLSAAPSCRPAHRRASESTGTEVMGFIHVFGDAPMSIWGVLAILSNLFVGLLARGGHRGLYLLSFSVLILFDVVHNRLSKPINSSNRSGKNGKNNRECSRTSGVLRSIGDDPHSAAVRVHACPGAWLDERYMDFLL